jgi:ferredoxin-type protein NapH
MSTARKSDFQLKNLITPAVIMLAFWGIAIWGFLASGYVQPLIMFGYIGTSLGVGLGLYAILPKKQKPIGRRLTLFLVGLFLIGFAIFMGRENVQLEGAIFGLLTGVVQMALIHYMIAKIFGPLLSSIRADIRRSRRGRRIVCPDAGAGSAISTLL